MGENETDGIDLWHILDPASTPVILLAAGRARWSGGGAHAHAASRASYSSYTSDFQGYGYGSYGYETRLGFQQMGHLQHRQTDDHGDILVSDKAGWFFGRAATMLDGQRTSLILLTYHHSSGVIRVPCFGLQASPFLCPIAIASPKSDA